MATAYDWLAQNGAPKTDQNAMINGVLYQNGIPQPRYQDPNFEAGWEAQNPNDPLTQALMQWRKTNTPIQNPTGQIMPFQQAAQGSYPVVNPTPPASQGSPLTALANLNAGGQPYIPGADNPNSNDLLERGLTPDQLTYYRSLINSGAGNPNAYAQAQKAASDALNLISQQNSQQQQLQQQNQQQAMQRANVLAQLQGQVPGLANQMADQLAQQTQYAYSKIDPIIQQRLNALGILQSGALPQAEAKAFTDLQMAAQNRVADFQNQANQQLQLQVPLLNTESDIASQQAALQQMLGLQQSATARQFSTEDAASSMALALQQQQQALALARQQAQQGQTNALIGAGGQIGGGLLGALFGAPGLGSGLAALFQRTPQPTGLYGGSNPSYNGASQWDNSIAANFQDQ